MGKQGSHAVGKTGKSREFRKTRSRSWKSLDFCYIYEKSGKTPEKYETFWVWNKNLGR